MGINLGVALGAAAQSGMNTYLKLGEEQRQEEELAMRRREANYQEEQRQQERELGKITALTLGGGDKRTVADQSTVNQGYEGADGPAATGYKEVAYTPQQQMADFKQRALAAGIPIQKVTAVSGAHRAEKYAEKEEMALEFNNQVMNDIKANPSDLGAVFKKHFEPLYNEGKLPGLNDGAKVELIPDGKGGQSMLFKDAKGKPTQPPVPLDIHAMEAITKKWGDLMMRSSNPANYWKFKDSDQKERELAMKEPYYKAETNKANAQAAALGAADSEHRKTSSPTYQKLLEQANDITDRINALGANPDPKTLTALRRESDMQQVKLANYLGKTLVPKERTAAPALTPVAGNPGLFQQGDILYQQTGETLTPVLTPVLKDKIAAEKNAIEKERQAGNKRTSALGVQSGGSHAAVDTWQPATAVPVSADRKAALADVNMRLKLAGISPQTEAELLLKRQELLGGTTGNRLLNARGID